MPSGLGKLVVPNLADWQAVFDTSAHTSVLPHPYTGVMTSYSCYVDAVTPRVDVSDTKSDCAVIAGLDVILSGIVVI